MSIKLFLRTPVIIIIIYCVIMIAPCYLYFDKFQYNIYDYLCETLSINGYGYNIIPVQKLMEIIPLVFIIVLSLLITVINTLIYVTYENNSKIRRVVYLLTLITITAILCLKIYPPIYDILKIDTTLFDADVTFKQQIIEEITQTIGSKVSELIYVLDYITISIFATLLIIDLGDYLLLKKKVKASKEKLNMKIIDLDNKNYLMQIFFIDIPVLLGVVFVKIFINAIDITTLSFNSESLTMLSFSVGATALQVIYSQVVFIIISIYYNYNKIKLSADN